MCINGGTTPERLSAKHRLARLLCSIALCTAALAQYDLSWRSIDGGGVFGADGGTFTLSGTIGQPDAGSFAAPMSGGTFELVGGFWAAAHAAPPCPGDLDGSGAVDLADLTTLLANFGTATGATRENGDFDGDGDVDLSDLTNLLANFGTTCP